MILSFSLILIFCLPWSAAEMTQTEMIEAVTSLVNHFHHPCAVIVTHPGVKPDIKTLMRKVQVQVVDRLEELEEVDTGCGIFVWLGEEAVVTLLGQERVRSGVWYVMASPAEQLLHHLRLRFDSQLYFLRRSGPKFDLVEVYDVTSGGRRVWRTWGSLHATTLEVEVPCPEMWHRRSDLWGLDLRAVVLPFGALRVVMPVLGHVLKHVPRHVLRHVPVRQVLEHVPGHMLEHVSKYVPDRHVPDRVLA